MLSLLDWNKSTETMSSKYLTVSNSLKLIKIQVFQWNKQNTSIYKGNAITEMFTIVSQLWISRQVKSMWYNLTSLEHLSYIITVTEHFNEGSCLRLILVISHFGLLNCHASTGQASSQSVALSQQLYICAHYTTPIQKELGGSLKCWKRLTLMVCKSLSARFNKNRANAT